MALRTKKNHQHLIQLLDQSSGVALLLDRFLARKTCHIIVLNESNHKIFSIERKSPIKLQCHFRKEEIVRSYLFFLFSLILTPIIETHMEEAKNTFEETRPDHTPTTELGFNGCGPGEGLLPSGQEIHHNHAVQYDNVDRWLCYFRQPPPGTEMLLLLPSTRGEKLLKFRLVFFCSGGFYYRCLDK